MWNPYEECLKCVLWRWNTSYPICRILAVLMALPEQVDVKIHSCGFKIEKKE